jgi:crotonobetainyl-CoA:carnitine CoA-transferase CaiB-like acyl-CoA transferase
MMEFIKKDGIDIGFLDGWDWDRKSWEDMTLGQAQKLMETLGKFFMNHSKSELLKLAIENRFQIGPCNNASDILAYPQLEARKFWKEIEQPELDRSLKYPGGAVMTTYGYVGVKHRAPRIGEHNSEIYKELGIPADELKALKKQNVI